MTKVIIFLIIISVTNGISMYFLTKARKHLNEEYKNQNLKVLFTPYWKAKKYYDEEGRKYRKISYWTATSGIICAIIILFILK